MRLRLLSLLCITCALYQRHVIITIVFDR
ncbi:Protein of unknown function [Pyronema omphalodes CBS 100304]|uniref:Uncharacterized protein n=1 Tax=Pyronema omphalodes (strain CBS 100304) TaxID=1076935 RepID=U4LSQ7_PYROM|nr:Protein of unknown function [Pyronema omphalodes CBS 100304]